MCTVFFRGCPVRCVYCQNAAILSGTEMRPISEVIEMIRGSRMFVSGIMFSGGEPTMQRDALVALAQASKDMGLLVGVQTNGIYPDTLDALIKGALIDRVALDIKARWARYNNLIGGNYVKNVQRSLALCRDAHETKKLPEFEIVVTLFRGYEDEVPYIMAEAGDTEIVLQQGVTGDVKPLSEEELKKIGDQMGRSIKIRTREGGELFYESDRSRRTSRKR